MKTKLTFFIVVFLILAVYNNNINAQSIPQESAPLNGSTWESTTPTLSWLLYNVYSTVNFSVQVSLSQNNFTNPYLVVNTTSSGYVSGSYNIPSGILAVGVTYYWRIGYNGNYSAVWGFTPSTGNSGVTPIVLIPPTLSTPQDSTINVTLNPTFYWTGVSGATSYEIEVSQSGNFLTTFADLNNIAGTSSVINGLTPGLTYYWRVRSVNNVGVSNWSDIFIFTTRPPIPSTPTLLSPVDNSSNLMLQVTLNWSHSQYDSIYSVQVALDPDFNTTILTIPTNLNTTQISLQNYNTTYYWRVRGTNFTGNGNWSSAFRFITKLAPPFPPILMYPTTNSTVPVNVLLVWTKGFYLNNVKSFKLEVSKYQSFNSDLQIYSGILDTVKLIIGLKPQTQYYWRVRSYSISDSSDWSSPFTFTTPLNAKNIYVDANNGADFAINNTPAGDGSLLRPYKSINKALMQLGPSGADTIRVANGAYPEVLNISYSVVIIGSPNTQIAALNILGQFFNPTWAIVVKNIEATFFPNPTNTGQSANSGIQILNFNNVLFDNVKVTNFSNAQPSFPSFLIANSQNITVTNSDFSNNLYGILIYGSNNIVLSNVKANSTPPAIHGSLSNPVYGLYVDNTKNINFTDLTFDSDDIGMGLKNVSNGTITNLKITNAGWYNSVLFAGALNIGSSSSLTFKNGQINENKIEAVIIDPTNNTLGSMGTTQLVPIYPNQNSINNSTDNLVFTGNYEFKNNGGGVFFTSPGFLSTSSVNSPNFTGTFIFSGNNGNSQTQLWFGYDIYISSKVNDLIVNGAQFINSIPYPSTYYQGPPNFSPATSKAIFISNFNSNGIIPVGSQPNGLVFNNNVFDQVSSNTQGNAIFNLTPFNVDARNNSFSYASSQLDIENLIYDSLDTAQSQLLNKSGRVNYSGSTFGGKLPPTISVGSLPTSFRGASYYLPVSIVTKGNNYNVLQGKFSYDASKLIYLGYLSNASGLINQNQWTTLSVRDTIVHNVTPPDSGFIQFYAFGNTPINTDGTLFKLNMQIQHNAAPLGNQGFTTIGAVNSNFLGNNQPVFIYIGSQITYSDPNGVIQSKGDVNLDGVVNMDDFMALLYHLLGIQLLTNPQALANADFDNNNIVNQADLNELFIFLNPGAHIVSPSVVAGTVSFSNISISQSSSVVVPVSLNNAKNVNSLELTLNYDPSKFKFQTFSNTLKLGDQYIHGIETNPGKAVFVVESPTAFSGTVSPSSLRFGFTGNSIPNGSVVTTQYSLNGQGLKDGPSLTFSNNIVTAVENILEIPKQFELMQNYPNPFNPTTMIRFAMPKNAFVTLKIYDMLGREVKTLISGERNAGSYSIEWNGSNNYGSRVASGAYIYRIIAGDFSSVKKMILLK